MAKTIKQFGYVLTKMGKVDIPVSPWVNIVFDRWGTDKSNSAPMLSPNLMSEAEIASARARQARQTPLRHPLEWGSRAHAC
jgi:hypothetical protein